MQVAVVIDHHLDEVSGVYRLTFAFPVTETVQVVDPEWTPPEPPTVEPPPAPELSELVEQEEDAEPLEPVPHEPAEEPPLIDQTVTTYVFPEEIVWEASDDRWFDDAGGRRPAADIAAEQQQIVKDLLDQRAVAAEHAANAPVPEPMPGIGKTL